MSNEIRTRPLTPTEQKYTYAQSMQLEGQTGTIGHLRGDFATTGYCYVKEWLDKHIQKAEQGIRFIDPQYKELFRIPDGGKVIVTTSWGEKREYPCRFIDEYHTEVGSNLYHICEFAERMQKNGATYEPKPAEQTPQKTPKHKDLER